MTRISILAAAGLSLAAASTASAFNGEDIPVQGTKLTGIAQPSVEANRTTVAEVTLPSGETVTLRRQEAEE